MRGLGILLLPGSVFLPPLPKERKKGITKTKKPKIIMGRLSILDL